MTCRNDCCTKSGEQQASARDSRWLDAVGWLMPATALALMPKCPLCVAAYAAIFTGIGLSLPAAALVRTTLIVLCAASLAFMTARTIARGVARSR